MPLRLESSSPDFAVAVSAIKGPLQKKKRSEAGKSNPKLSTANIAEARVDPRTQSTGFFKAHVNSKPGSITDQATAKKPAPAVPQPKDPASLHFPNGTTVAPVPVPASKSTLNAKAVPFEPKGYGGQAKPLAATQKFKITAPGPKLVESAESKKLAPVAPQSQEAAGAPATVEEAASAPAAIQEAAGAPAAIQEEAGAPATVEDAAGAPATVEAATGGDGSGCSDGYCGEGGISDRVPKPYAAALMSTKAKPLPAPPNPTAQTPATVTAESNSASETAQVSGPRQPPDKAPCKTHGKKHGKKLGKKLGKKHGKKMAVGKTERVIQGQWECFGAKLDVLLLESAVSAKQIERVYVAHNNLLIEVPTHFLSAMSPPPHYVGVPGTAASKEPPLLLKVEESAAFLPSAGNGTAKKVAPTGDEAEAVPVREIAKAEKAAEDNVTKTKRAVPAKTSAAWHQAASFRKLILFGIAAAAAVACAALAPPSAPGISPSVTNVSAAPVPNLHNVTAIEPTLICPANSATRDLIKGSAYDATLDLPAEVGSDHSSVCLKKSAGGQDCAHVHPINGALFGTTPAGFGDGTGQRRRVEGFTHGQVSGQPTAVCGHRTQRRICTAAPAQPSEQKQAPGISLSGTDKGPGEDPLAQDRDCQAPTGSSMQLDDKSSSAAVRLAGSSNPSTWRKGSALSATRPAVRGAACPVQWLAVLMTNMPLSQLPLRGRAREEEGGSGAEESGSGPEGNGSPTPPSRPAPQLPPPSQESPPSPPSPPLQPGSLHASSSVELMAALNDAAIDRIVLTAGAYGFSRNMCSNQGGAALCIDRAVTIVAEVPGSVVLDGGGARRVIHVSSSGNATLIGLNITRGFVGERAFDAFENGGAIYNDGGTMELHTCTLATNEAVRNGGAIYNSGGTMELHSCELATNVAGSNGGAIYNDGGTMELLATLLTDNQALVGGLISLITAEFANGGAIYNFGGSMELHSCELATNVAGYNGGAIFNDGGTMGLLATLLTGNQARGEAASSALDAVGGQVRLGNGTQFASNSFRVGLAEVIYVLPAPPGHYTNARKCEVVYAPCRRDFPCLGLCRLDRSLAPAATTGDSCTQPPFNIQPCPWNTDLAPAAFGEEILGLDLERILPGTYDQPEWPVPCPLGILGATADAFDGQRSASCAGLCPAGHLCPTVATITPVPCTEGHFCPAGSSIALPCHPGSHSDATDLTSAIECKLVDEGHFAPTGSTQQTPCAAGTVQPMKGMGTCVPCKAGTFQNETGSPECKPCVAGAYNPSEGSAFCIPCAPGTYAPSEGSAICTPCPAGKLSENLGSTTCDDCPKGGFCGETGAASLRQTFEPCPPGTVNPDSGQKSRASCQRCAPGTASPITGSSDPADCKNCSAGTAQPGAGQDACITCASGTFQDKEGQSSCGLCGAGNFSANVLSCEPCQIGEYCPESSTIGTSCPIGSTTEGRGAKSRDECGCQAGTYNNTAEFSCTACNDEDVQCERSGLTLTSIPLRQSKWRLSNRTADIRTCDTPGGASRCLGGNDSATYCAEGHEGVRCEVCSDNDRFYDSSSGSCAECGDLAPYALRQLAVLLAIAGGLALLQLAVVHLPRLLVRASIMLAKLAISAQQFGLQAKYKIVISFAQVWAVRTSVYGFSLPGELSDWLMLDGLSFDVGSFIIPSWTCVGGLSTRIVFNGAWPLGLMLAVALALAARTVARKGSLQSAALRSVEAAVFISFSLLPSVTRSLFLAFQCQSFGFDDLTGDSEPATKSFLTASLDIECLSGAHAPIVALASIFIIVWPVGVPLLFALLLHRCRRSILSHQPSRLSRAIRFLYSDYEDAYYWNEMLALAKKLMLTNVVLFINLGSSERLLRLLVGLLIAFLDCILQVQTQPFRKRVDNVLNCAVQIMLVLFFVLGIAIKICDTDDLCITLVGVNSAYDVSVLMICVGLAVVLIPAGMFVHQLISARRVPVLRDTRTLEPPLLLLSEGTRYHLFLSHSWGTGQDQCAVIKRQLQLLLPGVIVFLDVDDLVDIGDLEGSIRATGVILVFLSKGYFGSRNCLREITASLEHGKPLVLVQEQQEDKGGGPIDALKAECRDDQMRADIFNGRTPIVWHRISHYQNLTLKLIATEMLRNGPEFKGPHSAVSGGGAPNELMLYQHGEIDVSKLKLPRPIALWCSTANPGAVEIAAELVASMEGNGTEIRVVNSIQDAQALQTNGESAFMLLYLNKDTWIQQGELLERDVRAAWVQGVGLKVVLVHENDKEKGGCEFGDFFGTTPQELINDGIYRDIAIALHTQPHRAISLALVAKALGATATAGWAKVWRKFSRASKVSTRRGLQTRGSLPQTTAQNGLDLADPGPADRRGRGISASNSTPATSCCNGEPVEHSGVLDRSFPDTPLNMYYSSRSSIELGQVVSSGASLRNIFVTEEGGPVS